MYPVGGRRLEDILAQRVGRFLPFRQLTKQLLLMVNRAKIPWISSRCPKAYG